jgi:hypothetical protein
LQATVHLRRQDGWRDYNLVLEISNPLSLSDGEKRVCEELNAFLVEHGKYSISTVINTIFPASLYVRHGATEVFRKYRTVAVSLRKHSDWAWGTYFERMTSRVDAKGKQINPLEYLLFKLRRQAKAMAPKRAAYEISLVEAFLDIPVYEAGTDKGYHMGGPCLSHLSFKLKTDRSLLLTAVYRSHYYIERALGNFYGLALLQDFVAKECSVKPAELVCLSTMAVVDTEKVRRSEVANMLDRCMQLSDPPPPRTETQHK